MNQDIEICFAQSTDAEALAPLLRQLGYDNSAASIAETLDSIHATQGKVLLAKYSGRVVGCLHALIDVRLAEGTFAEFVSIVVDENFRGRGIGKNLMRDAEAYLKNEGCQNLRIRANTIREESHSIYLSQGFDLVKSQHIFVKAL
jgi:GNAT superfamily N-acetyltransferase